MPLPSTASRNQTNQGALNMHPQPNPFGGPPPKRKRSFSLGRFTISTTAVAVVALVLAACGGVVGSGIAGTLHGGELLQHEANVDNNALGRIEKNEPIPVLNDSSDAHNQRHSSSSKHQIRTRSSTWSFWVSTVPRLRISRSRVRSRRWIQVRLIRPRTSAPREATKIMATPAAQ